jgi:hypothetical protein
LHGTYLFNDRRRYGCAHVVKVISRCGSELRLFDFGTFAGDGCEFVGDIFEEILRRDV